AAVAARDGGRRHARDAIRAERGQRARDRRRARARPGAAAAGARRGWRRRARRDAPPAAQRRRPAARAAYTAAFHPEARGMRIETTLPLGDWRRVAPAAQRAEALGLDGVTTPEIANDPFVPLAFAALATERLQLGTAIAVAFPRSPMVVANLAWDLQVNSRGRFVLGLGPQVKGHNERRFSVPWSAP